MAIRGILTLLVMTAVGCASWTYGRTAYKRLCQEADWEELYYDAEIHRGRANNISQQKLNVLNEACPYHEIKPDPMAKANALARVQREFCAVDKAYAWGRQGNPKPLACNGGYQPEWRRGYQDYLVLQLEYLNNDGKYRSVYNRHLRGLDVSKKNLLAYQFAQAEAQIAATQELNIKPLAPKDDKERQELIREYSRRLDQLRTAR